MDMRGHYFAYLRFLMQVFPEEDAYKVLLLNSVHLLNPVLKNFRVGLDVPIAIVLSSDSLENQKADILETTTGISCYSTNLAKSKIREILLNAETEATFFSYTKGSNCHSNMELIRDACKFGQVDDVPIRTFPVVTFSTAIPSEALPFFAGQLVLRAEDYALFYGEENPAFAFFQTLIIFVCSNYDLIGYSIKQLKQTGEFKKLLNEFDDLKSFVAMEKIFSLFLENLGSPDEFQTEMKHFRQALNVIIDDWILENQSSKWGKRFLDELFKLAPSLNSIFPARKTPVDCNLESDGDLLYDEKFYGLNSVVFEEALKPLEKRLGINHAKEVLAETGILKFSSGLRTYYSTKMDISTRDGDVCKYRYQIDRKFLDEPCELKFHEMILHKPDARQEKRLPTLGYAKGVNEKIQISSQSNNNHILIVGDSGSGKTVAGKFIEQDIAKQGGAIIVVNFHRTHMLAPDNPIVNVIHASSEGVPLSFLKPSEDMSDEHAADFVCKIFKSLDSSLGSNQTDAIRAAAKLAQNNKSDFDNEVNALKDSLRTVKHGPHVVEKYGWFFDSANFTGDGNLWEAGKITVLDLSEYEPSVQKQMAGALLTILWDRLMEVGQTLPYPVWIVCDEFRALDIHGLRVISQILREGRKFQTSMISSTQILSIFGPTLRSDLLLASTKLFFSPVDSEVHELAELIALKTKLTADELVPILTGLRKGDFIAVGNLAICKDHKIRALKMRYRIDELEI